MKVFSGSSNQPLARKLAKKLGVKLGKVELSSFANNELRVRVVEKNVGDKAIVVQSLSEPVNHHLVELLLMVNALKQMGVKKIVGVIPYMGYSKQDKVFRQGEPLSIKVIAEVLGTAGFEKILTVDLHNPESIKWFKTPIVNLSARDLLVEEFKAEADKETVVLAPDKGGVKSAEIMGKKLGVKVVYVNKKRDLETGKVKVLSLRGEVKHKKVLIFDDMLATGSTLVQIANFLRKQRVQLIKVGLTHHLYIPGVRKKIDKSPIDKLIATDSIEPKTVSKKLKIISLAKVLAEKIEA